jgi:hypothetical protein
VSLVYEANIDMGEVHSLSVDLLRFLEDEHTAVDVGQIAIALTFGRLMSPKVPMTKTDEEDFLQAIMDYTSAYFSGGGIN